VYLPEYYATLIYVSPISQQLKHMFRDKCMETLRKYMDPRLTKHGNFIPLTNKYFGSRKDGMKRESGALKFYYNHIQKFRSCPRSCRSDVDRYR